MKENEIYSLWREAPETDKWKYESELLRNITEHVKSMRIIYRISEIYEADILSIAAEAAFMFKGELVSAKFSSWLQGIISNACKNILRAQKTARNFQTELKLRQTLSEDVSKEVYLQMLKDKLPARGRILVDKYISETLADDDIKSGIGGRPRNTSEYKLLLKELRRLVKYVK